MKAVSLWLALCLASISGAWAQNSGLTVAVTLDQDQYLPGEELRVAVRITNMSGRTVRLGEEENWLTFNVEASDNFIIEKYGNPSVQGEFFLDSSMTATKRVNIAPYFNLQKAARYRVTARVKIPQWGQETSSPPKSFNIMGGTKLRTLEFGVPPSADASNEPPEMRKYILQQAEYGKEMKLYLRLTDASEARIMKVFPLARMVSFSKPEAQIDRFSNLHVLHQTGQKSYNYCSINPDGQILMRQTHEILGNSHPRLKAREGGRIEVSGGAKRTTPNDLPPPELTSLPATNVNNATDGQNPNR